LPTRRVAPFWIPLSLEVCLGKILRNKIKKNYFQGVIAAQSGELTFMVGGDKAVFEKAKDVLGGMGKKLVHCGDIGMGQAAKICNNMLLGISMAGVAEAMNLGIRLGLDGKLLMDIINNSTGRCWSSEIYNPVPGLMPNVPSARNYEVLCSQLVWS
jgi:3-hydroxyisobutyrate dehydrogenase-like beta-hydroxyacid dehydrogenase